MEISKLHIYGFLISVLIPYLVAKSVSLNDIIAAESKQKQETESTQHPTPLSDAAERNSRNKIIKARQSKKLKKSALLSKSVSLNDILAAESKQKQQVESRRQPLLPDTSERFSLNKILTLKPRISKKLKIPETILPGKRSSLLKFRERFLIKSPLKARRLKFVQKPRHKRKYQSIKRETYENDKFNKKYIPLLSSLRELFDNMLPSDSGESSDIERSQIKLRRRNKNKDENQSSCTCDKKSRAANLKPSKKTTAPTTISTKESTTTELAVTPTQIPSATSSYAAYSDISDLGSNTDIPILLTKDTLSPGRDDSRLSKGSSPTRHTSTEGNIPRDNGNSERDTAHGKNSSSSTDYEANPDSDSRNNASGSGFEGGRGLRGDRDDTRSPVFRKTQETNEDPKNKDALRQFRGYPTKFKGEIDLEMGRDEAKSTTHIPQFVPGFRGFVPMGEIRHSSKSLQSKEVYEKSIIGIPGNFSSNQRILNRDGTFTAKNQEAGETNATVISIKDLAKTVVTPKSPTGNAAYVTIIDGYSVARGKNGSNQLSEQSIRFHS